MQVFGLCDEVESKHFHPSRPCQIVMKQHCLKLINLDTVWFHLFWFQLDKAEINSLLKSQQEVLVRRLSSVFAGVGVDLSKSETVELTIEKEGVGRHGGITDDGETGGTSVDDT